MSEFGITPRMMLPDLLRARPALRSVLDRYGLRGCGGPHGPAESVEYFARAHGVDLAQLLDELRAAAELPEADSPAPATRRGGLDELADTIYRRFFKAGMVVVMTAGAVWGALLLVKIGFAHAFTAISIHDVNAHGHAQIFGWVGLFVMGFAYQAFPRMRHTNLWRPDLANLTFYLMVFGIFARALGEPLFTWPLLRELAVAASFAEIAAIGLFIVVLLKTFQQSGKPWQRHDPYVLASLAFFLVQAVYDLGLLYATTAAVSHEELLRLIATFQPPLRDLQIHGFALLMILGVGLRMFPPLFGLPAPGGKLVRRGLVALVAGVVGESVFFILMRRTGSYIWGIPTYAAMLLLAGASIGLTLRWGLFAPRGEADRSRKFVRMGVAWLHTSMLMLVLLPVYLHVVLPSVSSLSESGRQSLAIGFSHAYYGAARHAITVGFISLMILGMAAKVVPTLGGVDIRKLRPLWLPFVLVNTGCLMRVAFQIGTDFAEWAYPLTGVSGLLEVTGIAIWGVHLWRIMAGQFAPVGVATLRPKRIGPDDKIGLITGWFPQTLPVLLGKGFAPLANPLLRRTLARAVTVRMAAAHQRLDLDALLDELNLAAFGSTCGAGADPAQRLVSLQVLTHA